MSSKKRTVVWLIVCGAVATLATVTAIRLSRSHDPQGYRPYEPRLSVSAKYAPVGGTSTSRRERLRAAIGEARGANAGDAAAVASLLAGDIPTAIDRLKGAPPTPANLNDLAAVLLVRAEQLDDGNLIVDALAATDRALAVDASYPPALFNRALALERLGLVREARRAWSRSIAVEPASRWSEEALRRLHALGLSNGMQRARAAFASLRSSVANTADVVENHGELARRAAETEVLADWGTAFLAGDAESAAQQLELAREVGRTLLQKSGERLLFDAVAAIVSRPSTTLAQAHVAYRNARRVYAKGDLVAAETQLREVADAFARAGSPMQFPARYYHGGALHAQHRLDEALHVLNALAREPLRERGYLTAAAQLGWERGACLFESGAMSDAIDVFTRSSVELHRLGETDAAAAIDGFLAITFDFVGDPVSGWRERRRALHALTSAGNDSRALVILESAAATATRTRQWERARVLLDLTVDGATQIEHAALAAHALTERAVVHARQGRASQAHADVATSREWLAKLTDEAMRHRGEADLAFGEAVLDAETHPERALERFDRAVDFYERAGRRVDTSRIYLERARVARNLGRLAEARSNVEAGLAVIAHERSYLREPEARASLQAASEELFDDAVAFAIDDGDTAGAFRHSEARSARMLTELFELGAEVAAHSEVAPLSLQQLQMSLAPNAGVVAFATLPDRLVTFVIRRDRFVATTTPVRRNDVVATIDELSRSIAGKRPDAIARATRVGDLLLRDVRSALAGATDVAFVTDRYTAAVPFNTLRDAATGRFAVEDFAIVTAPSATLLVSASRHMQERTNDTVLAIGASEFDMAAWPTLQQLPEVAREARDIAALYDASALRMGYEAPVALAETFANYGTVHFAGHAIADRDDVRRSALLFAPNGDDRGELRLRDIARLRMRATRLVVLAACRSADEVSRGDGVQNLALGFTAAGVPSVIASLWNLDDRVSRMFMTDVHRHLRRDTSPSRAIQSTARSRLRDSAGNPRLPMEWAGVVVIGGSPDLIERGER